MGRGCGIRAGFCFVLFFDIYSVKMSVLRVNEKSVACNVFIFLSVYLFFLIECDC